MKALNTMKKITLLNALVLTLAMAVSLSAGANDTPFPTDKWISAFGGECLLNGKPLPIGAIVQAFDVDGILCGRFIVDELGHYGFLSVYRDDIYTPTRDEGAEPGEPITLIVNGITTQQMGPDSPIWSKNGDPYNVNLSATQNIAFNLQSPVGQFTSPAQTLVYLFRITNSGDGFDFFDLNAYSQHGWETEIIEGTRSAYADPAQVLEIRVRVKVPTGIVASMTDSLFLEVNSGMDNTVAKIGKTISTIIVTAAEDDNSSIIPEKFSLSQNYPNPFNPETIIRYALKNGGHVRLQIYNMLGQNAAVLVDEYQDAGEYSVVWNALQSGQNYPSGVYFYRLTVNELTLTRKMLLMK